MHLELHPDEVATTRLSRLHPYPAMVADDLACALARDHVPPASRVLDPFCGSGRLLAAASQASLRVGTDVNPLACLLTRAKLSAARAGIIASALADISEGRHTRIRHQLRYEDRKVSWFSDVALKELGQIVAWVDSLRLDEPELLVMAAAVSATVREVSFARQSGWKLHRLDETSRQEFETCAWRRLERRLRYCLKQLNNMAPVLGEIHVELADARRIGEKDSRTKGLGPFDIVLTSPPYGDSRTTVQYGAASSLCMSIVSSLRGLGYLRVAGKFIDAACLGGRPPGEVKIDNLNRYWAGLPDSREGRVVVQFLADYEQSCEAIAANLVSGGKAVVIVGRRSTGGHSLFLDRFTEDRLTAHGFDLARREERELQKKRVPGRINRFARSADASVRASGIMSTMASEVILVMNKK